MNSSRLKDIVKLHGLPVNHIVSSKNMNFKKLKEIMTQHQVTELDVLRRLGKKRFAI